LFRGRNESPGNRGPAPGGGECHAWSQSRPGVTFLKPTRVPGYCGRPVLPRERMRGNSRPSRTRSTRDTEAPTHRETAWRVDDVTEELLTMIGVNAGRPGQKTLNRFATRKPGLYLRAFCMLRRKEREGGRARSDKARPAPAPISAPHRRPRRRLWVPASARTARRTFKLSLMSGGGSVLMAG